jgi:regulatory protein PHO2
MTINVYICLRRAKAKLQDGKNKAQSDSTETPPDTPPELAAGFEADLHSLIHEDERKSLNCK